MVTAAQTKRLKKLVHFLEEVVHRTKFDLRHWIGRRKHGVEGDPNPRKMARKPSEKSVCNTSACVVGWFPYLFPKFASWKKLVTMIGK